MTTVYEIPVRPTPQRFEISLSGKLYRFTLKWNDVLAYWILDVADEVGTAILCGVPIITGADLLAQFSYLGFTGELFATTDHNPDAVPTFDNFGINGRLFYAT